MLLEELHSFKVIPVYLGSFHCKLFLPALPQLFLLFSFTFLSSSTHRLFSNISNAPHPSSAYQSHCSSSPLPDSPPLFSNAQDFWIISSSPQTKPEKGQR